MFEKYDAYKDSGTEWLGKVPRHWILTKVKRYLTVQSGDMLKPKDLSDDGIPIVGGNGYRGFTYKSNTLANTLVIGRVGAKCGCIHLIKEDFWASEHAFKVIPRKSFNQKFMAYFLENMNLNKYAITTAQPLLNTEIVTSQVLAIPTLDEQERIAYFLDQKTSEIDQAIATREQQIALLNERKQIVIQKVVTQGLDLNVAMKDSGVEWIRQIPEHWEIIKVKNLFKLIIEPAPKNNDLELLSVYTDIGVKPRKELEERGNKASTTDGYWKVRKGDIIVNKLLAWMGAIGLSNYDGVTSPAYDILRAVKPLNPYIYHLLFRSPTCSAELKKHSRGIMDMRLRLYFDKFGDVLVPYAPIAEQNEIIKYIEVEEQKINAGIELINQQIEKLKEYKTTLINDAVTGKIKVA